MLSPIEEKQIAKLVGEGVPRRVIASRLAISRGPVDRIARGRSVTREGEVRRRCCSCGALVTPPCRACGVRRTLRAAGQVYGAGELGLLALNLKAADHQRYQTVVAARGLEKGKPKESFEDPPAVQAVDDLLPTEGELLAIDAEIQASQTL